MKALTLHQPWASLVALGVKTIETRSWATKYRGPLAIHAGARKPRRIWSQRDRPDLYDDYRMDRYLDIQEDGNNPGQFAYDWIGPLGVVVATCTLVDVVPMRGPGEVVGSCIYVPDGRSADFPDPERLWGWSLSSEWPAERHPYLPWVDVTAQRPYGDFTPGRFAWLLADIQPLTPPVPARGRQQLWEWGGEL